jgi:hypothetical protein
MTDLFHSDGLATWRKATHSGQQGSCVEVAHLPERVGVRDTKSRDSGHFDVPTAAWMDFVGRLRN